MYESNELQVKNSETSAVCHMIPWAFPDELALCEAVRHENVKEISKYIANNVNVNCVDGFGKTPLHYACAHGSYEIVKLLVANKALVNVWDSNITTPLHLAAKGNHVKIVKFLIMCKADFNRECASACKPIDYAIYDSETWNTLLKASNGELPNVDHLVHTPTIPFVPKFAIKREINKQALLEEMNKKKGKEKGKGKGKK